MNKFANIHKYKYSCTTLQEKPRCIQLIKKITNINV